MDSQSQRLGAGAGYQPIFYGRSYELSASGLACLFISLQQIDYPGSGRK
jgi:hypothetical protein